MSGTIEGGKAAARTNIEKYGTSFYARIGAIGGKRSQNGGFASAGIGTDGLTGKERAAVAGKKGGEISRRGKSGN